MKKILTLSLLMCVLTIVKAQKFEIRASPIGAIVGKYNINMEYLPNDQIGIDFSPSYSHFHSVSGSIPDESQRNTWGLQLAAKYYFSPDKGGDGISFGPYFSYYTTTFVSSFQNPNTGTLETNISKADPQWVIGGMMTYKWVFDNNLMLEAGSGSGYILTGARNTGSAFFSNPFSEIDVTLRLSVGYRFGGKKVIIKK
jgi:hypothetical protein